jgi:hypothetical protein
MLAITVLVCGHALQAADFMTTAEINKASLNTDSYRKVGRFYADVTVKNVSTSSQPITLWTNPGWSWVTDSNDVATSQEAAENLPTRIMLKPDEVYKSRLEMAADPKGTRPTTFRLGFLANANRPTMDAHDPALIWSNSVTLEQIR